MIDLENKTTNELEDILRDSVFNMLSCEDRLAVSKELQNRKHTGDG